jgi:ureidoglycolate amidohydrolase
MNLAINSDRLNSEIEELSKISEAAPPVVTRIVFTPADLKARAWLGQKCAEAGLAGRQDAIGNTFYRWIGSNPSDPVVATGSHIDAIPNAGKYDGVVGVLGGLEAIRALRASGFRPKRSIELILFTSEEPTRFGIGCLGSRMLAGVLTPGASRGLKDDAGESLEEVRLKAGMLGALETVPFPTNHYAAFVELHIEQGPLLENAGVPLGIVESIAAPASLKVAIEGAGGHAGGVLMADRKDALCAAAEVILMIEAAARQSGAADTVATVGICNVFPGAVNSIPSRVQFTLDARDTDLARRNAVLETIQEKAGRVAERRGVNIRFEIVNADQPAACSPFVIKALEDSCRANKYPFQKMVSRAYHDSLFMSRVAPTAMLFIPCHKGYSHRPDEFAAPEDIARGTRVLAEALASLSD